MLPAFLMRISPRQFVSCIVIAWVTALLGGAVHYYGSEHYAGTFMMMLGIAVSYWAALVFMIRAGTLIQSRQWRIMKFLFGILIIGALFKILHLMGANLLTYLPFPLMTLVYIWHFFEKKTKKRLDLLKAMWVISFTIVSFLDGMHLSKPGIYLDFVGYDLITMLLFWITFLDFYFFNFKSRMRKHLQNRSKV